MVGRFEQSESQVMEQNSALEAVPTFYLYGEPQQTVTGNFVHVEDLDDRSRPSEWTIRPHVHRHLNHLILIADGGGAMQAEGASVSFNAASLLLIPAGTIHGFSWHRESRGWVITVADSFLHELLARDGDLPVLFQAPGAIALSPENGRLVEEAVIELSRELSWSGRGRRAAIEAALLSIMVRALRQAMIVPSGARMGERGGAELVARLRARIEQRFRLREPVSAQARALGVSETRLRRACQSIAGRSPAAMQDERALLEARRLLFYSQLTIAEVAYAVGFEDPAYFSRFFTRHMGEPPKAHRDRRGEPRLMGRGPADPDAPPRSQPKLRHSG